MITDKELEFVRKALQTAAAAGAQHARATLSKSEEDLVATLDGEVDRVTHCADRSLSLALFVDGRFGSFSTNKLDADSLRTFIAKAVETVREVTPDPFRTLPDPARCCQDARTGDELGLVDPAREALTPDERQRIALGASVHSAPLHGGQPPETSNSADVEVGISRPAGPGTLQSAKSERGLWPQGVTGGGAPFIDRPRVAVFPEAVPADVPQESVLRLRMAEEQEAETVFAAGVQPGDTLLEPCPALLKAGAFNLPCARWSLRKLAPSTHLYLAPAPPGANTPDSAPGNPDFPFPGADSCPDAPGSPWFKAWRVLEVLPFGAAAFRQVKQRWPRAGVTARNLPLGSAELQKRMGVSPGGDTHIFACRLADGAAVLLVTEQ